MPAFECAVERCRLRVPQQVRYFGNGERRVGQIELRGLLPRVITERIEGSPCPRQTTLQRAWGGGKPARHDIDAYVAGGHLCGKHVPHFISNVGAGWQTGQHVGRPALEPSSKCRIPTTERKTQ